MPWEGQTLTFRWEVFIVTNTQALTGFNGTGLNTDPYLFGGQPPAGFGNMTATQPPLGETKSGRVMPFALRYVFWFLSNLRKASGMFRLFTRLLHSFKNLQKSQGIRFPKSFRVRIFIDYPRNLDILSAP